MSNDQQPDPEARPPQPTWGGTEYDGDTTGYFEFPPGSFPGTGRDLDGAGEPDPGADPLAAPGHGYQPPEIGSQPGSPATPGPTTDPGEAGPWTMPFAGGEPAAPSAASQARSAAAAMAQGAAAALAGSQHGRTGRRPLGEGPETGHDAAPPGAVPPDGGGPPAPSPWSAPPGGEQPHPPEPAVERAGLAVPVPEDATEGDGEPDEPDGAAQQHSQHPEASYVLRVNGVDRPVTGAWIGESLLYVLRERLGLAGAKDGCAQGECGACSVQVDGRLLAACLVPAATAAGSEIRTVEGLSEDGVLSDVQRAIADAAVQCGFCLPGMAMTVHDLLEGNHAPTELETRQALSGNLCRCTGYRGVLDAVRAVVAERSEMGVPPAGGWGRAAARERAASEAADTAADPAADDAARPEPPGQPQQAGDYPDYPGYSGYPDDPGYADPADHADHAGHSEYPGPGSGAARIPHQAGPPSGGV